MACAELATLEIQQLRRKDQSLIRCQLPNKRLQAAELLASDRHPFGLGARVGDLDLGLVRTTQWHGALERGLHRAPSRKSAAPVADPRDEALLDDVGEMLGARENGPSAGVGHELERRLAEAVLEILPAQSMTMGAKQHLAPGARHLGDPLGRVKPFA